ncbi:response regulator transcription factor [Microbacterium sp. GXF7504]
MASILVVEDDADVAGLISLRLSSSGHLVEVAPDGEAGIEAARATVPDLVILDWMMPRKNGIEVCAELRADDRFLGTKIMMLTARAKDTDREQAFSVGVDDYVTKPFSSRELLARVDQLV